MKKVLFIIITVMFVISLLAQNKKDFFIPERVKSALTKLYPDAKNIYWKKDDNKTEASFVIGGKNISVTFDSNEFYAAKTQIQPFEIPKPVKQSLDEYYNGYKIISVGIITDKLNNIFYGTELKKTTVLIKVMFDKKGNLVRNDKLPH